MAELVLNRFKIEIKKEHLPQHIIIYKEDELNDDAKYYLPRYKPSKILERKIVQDPKTENWLKELQKTNIEDEDYLYISYTNNSDNPSHKTEINFNQLNDSLKKKFLKEVFITILKNDFIVEPFKEGVDLSIYEKEKENDYIRFDVVFNIHQDNYSMTIMVGSTNTFIGKIPVEKRNQIQDILSLKYCRNTLLVKQQINDVDDIFAHPVKANAELRRILKKEHTPLKKFYKTYFDLIKNFVQNISEKLKDYFLIHTKFETVTNIKMVSFEKNKMVFNGGNEDYSTINGMRDYGPYEVPNEISQTKLLFVYPDKESANKLYEYLSRGYRHFPGLESYVGIPANIFNIKINYNNNLSELPDKINTELKDPKYNNVIAVCIMPFSKSTATKEQSKVYYQIKKAFLEKNIPTQFIHRDKIFEENFHFSLPNIAIAMLAKCGGIPWRLARPHYKQLIIGFNVIHKKDDNRRITYLGSAVFFDNKGIIREVKGFNGETINKISDSLVESIRNFKQEYSNIDIDKIKIHYYKTLSNKESLDIEKIIKKELEREVTLVIVEINDTKTSNDLCFDLDYESYMPQSGTYIHLKPNEYLLFNNLRYWEKPINPITQEELPVKLRIYSLSNSVNHSEIISQVYEFSRMYWKSLKQKAQPVTTIYSKLIAQYLSEFGGSLPDNEVVKSRIWFI